MKKKLIRLTESDLHNIIKESVNNILKEYYDVDGMSYGQVRNMTGIEDDDELNAGAECEAGEELQSEIFKSIASQLCNGGNPRMYSFGFQDLIKLLADEFDFEYVGPDESNESYEFAGDGRELCIFPRVFYPSPNKIRIQNMILY